MGKFDQFNTKEKNPEPMGGVEVSGAFECDQCDKISTVAMHNRMEKRLAWICSEGHSNSIRFNL